MARIQYGSIVNRIDGKVSGQVFQRCGQSFSLRNKSAVRTSQSAASIATRNDFSKLAYAWRSMDASQQQSFIDYASTYPTYDRYGNLIILTGYQLFMYINRTTQLIGLDPIVDCASYVTPDQKFLEINSTSAALGQIIVQVDSLIPVDNALLVYLSDQLYNTRSITAPKTFFVWQYYHGSSFPDNLWTHISQFYPEGLKAGRTIYMECWNLDMNYGFCARGSIDSFVIS